MKKILPLFIIILTSNFAEAQFIKEKSIAVQIGYGATSAYSSRNELFDDGFFANGEFVLKVASWIELRPYVGLILTSSNGTDYYYRPTLEKTESKACLLGGKVRVRAPIPWVAPFIEFGIGTSIGEFVTFTAYDNIDKTGVIYHIPLSFGVELGKNSDVDLTAVYYFQPSVEQLASAFAFALQFPLNTKK